MKTLRLIACSAAVFAFSSCTTVLETPSVKSTTTTTTDHNTLHYPNGSTTETQTTRYALIPIPEALGRRVNVTVEGDGHGFILIEDLVAAHAKGVEDRGRRSRPDKGRGVDERVGDGDGPDRKSVV